jgi:hypothetical protein
MKTLITKQNYQMFCRVGQNVFSCSMAVILKNDIINCDSSWQDILLVSWLEVSSGWGMLFYIDKEEIQTLQVLIYEYCFFLFIYIFNK